MTGGFPYHIASKAEMEILFVDFSVQYISYIKTYMYDIWTVLISYFYIVLITINSQVDHQM